MILTQRLITSILVGALLTSTCAMAESTVGNSIENKALFIVTSDSLQTQGMAMVLGNAMQEKGVSVDVLLCDQAGDLALSSTVSKSLKPLKTCVVPVQATVLFNDPPLSTDFCRYSDTPKICALIYFLA